MSEEKAPEGRLLYVPPPKQDVDSNDIKTYSKIYNKGGQKQEIKVPYIPQPVVHKFISEYFGLNISIENLGYQLHEYTIEGYNKIKQNKVSVVRFFRLWFTVEVNGKPVDRFIDFAGACDLDNRTDFNQALHTAETSAFKELLKMLGKGLKAYERLDNVSYDVVETIEQALDSVDLDSVLNRINQQDNKNTRRNV